jgi:hypothetical protein
MKKFVKILLVILAVLLIAGGGFWSGTRFAFRQTAANTAQAAGTTAAQANTNQPGFDRQRESGRFGPGASNNDGADNSKQGKGWSGNRSFGPGMMAQNRQSGGTMMNRFNGGFGGMSLGHSFFGGGLMLLGLLFPLGFAVLMILGIIVLFRTVRKPAVNSTVGSAVCTKCGAAVQNDWKHCPQCGNPI